MQEVFFFSKNNIEILPGARGLRVFGHTQYELESFGQLSLVKLSGKNNFNFGSTSNLKKNEKKKK
jgi:hypothetical protein